MWIRFISIGSHLVSFICIQIPIFRLGHDEICSLIFSIGKISFTNVPVLHTTVLSSVTVWLIQRIFMDKEFTAAAFVFT